MSDLEIPESETDYTEVNFTACKNLDYHTPYSAKLAQINSGGVTKLAWERHDPDGILQLCQFCKLNGRHNNPESCLDSGKADCGHYEDCEHNVLIDAGEINGH